MLLLLFMLQGNVTLLLYFVSTWLVKRVDAALSGHCEVSTACFVALRTLPHRDERPRKENSVCASSCSFQEKAREVRS